MTIEERYEWLCAKLNDYKPTRKQLIWFTILLIVAVGLVFVLSVVGSILALYAVMEFFKLFFDVVNFLVTGRT